MGRVKKRLTAAGTNYYGPLTQLLENAEDPEEQAGCSQEVPSLPISPSRDQHSTTPKLPESDETNSLPNDHPPSDGSRNIASPSSRSLSPSGREEYTSTIFKSYLNDNYYAPLTQLLENAEDPEDQADCSQEVPSSPISLSQDQHPTTPELSKSDETNSLPNDHPPFDGSRNIVSPSSRPLSPSGREEYTSIIFKSDSNDEIPAEGFTNEYFRNIMSLSSRPSSPNRQEDFTSTIVRPNPSDGLPNDGFTHEDSRNIVSQPSRLLSSSRLTPTIVKSDPDDGFPNEGFTHQDFRNTVASFAPLSPSRREELTPLIVGSCPDDGFPNEGFTQQDFRNIVPTFPPLPPSQREEYSSTTINPYPDDGFSNEGFTHQDFRNIVPTFPPLPPSQREEYSSTTINPYPIDETPDDVFTQQDFRNTVPTFPPLPPSQREEYSSTTINPYPTDETPDDVFTRENAIHSGWPSCCARWQRDLQVQVDLGRLQTNPYPNVDPRCGFCGTAWTCGPKQPKQDSPTNSDAESFQTNPWPEDCPPQYDDSWNEDQSWLDHPSSGIQRGQSIEKRRATR